MFDLGDLTGHEMIEFEELTGKTYLGAVTEVMDGNVTAKTALGISYVLAKRDDKKLKWDKHLEQSSAASLAPILTFGTDDEDDSDSE